MKTQKKQTPITFLLVLLFCMDSILSFGQNSENNDAIPTVISTAPIKYRVNERDGKTSHGYYSKGYNLSIYGDTNLIGYRADCDMDDDWSGANPEGTTQDSNSFESKYRCVFNPHKLYGTVLPGSKNGQNHYDGFKRVGVEVGDISITIKIDSEGKVVDTVLGVVFDRGPHNQPGESSVATCKKLKVMTDNNEYIYVIYPNSSKFLKQVIGTMPNSNKLKRNPTNADVEKAFQLMSTQDSENNDKRIALKKRMLQFLSSQPMKSYFDNPTDIEKREGRQKPRNNDRNANE
ncbi:hypothetical protein [Flavobacterium sp.]|uniref:hypothetical protein n=1 Tax=Flavobacterium sp. TaxID=239 RepID=UPI003D6A3BBF